MAFLHRKQITTLLTLLIPTSCAFLTNAPLFKSSAERSTISFFPSNAIPRVRHSPVVTSMSSNPFESIFGGFSSTNNAEQEPNEERGLSVVEKYFDAWNRRDMDEAITYFAEDCTYEDTQYANAFTGKEALQRHLFKVSNALPATFQFVVDDIVVTKQKIGVQWHVENDGQELPFTRGCSFYTLDENGLIRSGFDVPEPAPFKPGGVGLTILSIASKLIQEPVRTLPFAVWIAYIYIVFFSNGILPGVDATQLEARTWEEVRDLSLNFFLISPLLKLPFAPTVHPMLEGIFNLLLSWAAMFAGFLSDERDDKRNTMPMVPTVIGMQFLTSAFFLPYLAFRNSEDKSFIYREDLDSAGRNIGENRVLYPVLGGVGIASVLWAFVGRPEFGEFSERYASLIDLLSIDRVGSSFVVDLVIFGLFQWWLVNDDLRRRGVDVEGGELSVLANVAKFIPFLGLVPYFLLRPQLESREDAVSE